MKHFVFISIVVVFLLSSCALNKTTHFEDDVYSDPKLERIEDAKLIAIQNAKNEEIKKRFNDSISIQNAKDNANPYYKDKDFKFDDYYDYEYATRVKRFNNSINGLSYYDNYYTNSYWYNQNAYNYGVSVYNGYSWWGNSYNNYNYNPAVNFYANNGWGCNSNYGYNGYNPYISGYSSGFNYGYNSGYNDGYFGSPYGNYFGYGYNPYGYNSFGYNNWNNGYGNNGWGYYNSYDNNSYYTYGPRSSHGGSNGRLSSNPGMKSIDDSYYNRYATTVIKQQEESVKFSPVSTPKTKAYNQTQNIYNQPNDIKNNNPTRNINNSVRETIINNNSYEQPARNNYNNDIIQEQKKQQPSRREPEIINYEQPSRHIDAPIRQEEKSQPINNGGHRPR